MKLIKMILGTMAVALAMPSLAAWATTDKNAGALVTIHKGDKPSKTGRSGPICRNG